MEYIINYSNMQELLLLLLPLLNSSSVKNFLRPVSRDKSSDSSIDDILHAICQGKPTISLVSTATVTTVFNDVGNRLLLCIDMVVRSTTLVRYNNSCERCNEMTGKASFSQTMDQKLPKDNIEIKLGIKIP